MLWRAQKCILLVGSNSALNCAGPQTTLSQLDSIWPRKEIWGIPGLAFAMVQCLHQSNVYIKPKLGLWRGHKCTPLVGAKSALTCACLQTTPSHVRQYRAENGNLGKSGPSFCHGAVFAPKQCLYMKTNLGLWRAKKCIPLVDAKSALTCAGLQTTLSHVRQYMAKNGNLVKSRPSFHHGAVFAPKQCLCQKEARAMESPKMYSSCRCKNSLTCAGPHTTPSHVRQYRAEDGNFGKSWPSFHNGAVFAPKQYLYQKEARAMESPKMYSSSRWKNRTYLCGSTNSPVSCKTV